MEVTVKRSNIYLIGVPEERGEETPEQIMAENIPKLIERYHATNARNPTNPKHNKLKKSILSSY